MGAGRGSEMSGGAIQAHCGEPLVTHHVPTPPSYLEGPSDLPEAPQHAVAPLAPPPRAVRTNPQGAEDS